MDSSASCPFLVEAIILRDPKGFRDPTQAQVGLP